MAGYPRYFYPRPPRGGRPEFPVRNANREIISIHALREEGDRAGLPESAGRKDFYPRPPRGGRRQAVLRRMRPPDISIHALREEGDARKSWRRTTRSYFYPRPPRGGQPSAYGYLGCRLQISIHALREEGDQWDANVDQLTRISIHALREEGDTRPGRWGSPRIYFYPRPPRGGRPRQPARSPSSCNFYPRPPRGGRLACKGGKPMKNQFLSTPSARRATERLDEGVGDVVISIHALREEGDTTSRNSKTA